MTKEVLTYHVPVLLKQSVDGLDIDRAGVYVDVTFGGGGHSREILSRLGKDGRLIAFDQDKDAEQNIIDDARFMFVRSNFRFLNNFLRYYEINKVDGILADLGVSWHHFDDSERGFSFRFDATLDMRMNRDSSLKASDVVNDYDEERLADIFYLYGELKQSHRIAAAIVKARQKNKICSVQEFVDVVKPLFPQHTEKKDMARLFQALRIEVNHEMDALRDMLLSSIEALKTGGRLVVITYHSLEDRMVKNIMKTGNLNGKVEADIFGNTKFPFKIINNRVIIPDDEEISANSRARSAKLRIAEKRL